MEEEVKLEVLFVRKVETVRSMLNPVHYVVHVDTLNVSVSGCPKMVPT